MAKRFDYAKFEEELETLLGLDIITEWKCLNVGQYRLNNKVDVYPKAKRFFYLPDEQWGDWTSLEELLKECGDQDIYLDHKHFIK